MNVNICKNHSKIRTNLLCLHKQLVTRFLHYIPIHRRPHWRPLDTPPNLPPVGGESITGPDKICLLSWPVIESNMARGSDLRPLRTPARFTMAQYLMILICRHTARPLLRLIFRGFSFYWVRTVMRMCGRVNSRLRLELFIVSLVN